MKKLSVGILLFLACIVGTVAFDNEAHAEFYSPYSFGYNPGTIGYPGMNPYYSMGGMGGMGYGYGYGFGMSGFGMSSFGMGGFGMGGLGMGGLGMGGLGMGGLGMGGFGMGGSYFNFNGFGLNIGFGSMGGGFGYPFFPPFYPPLWAGGAHGGWGGWGGGWGRPNVLAAQRHYSFGGYRNYNWGHAGVGGGHQLAMGAGAGGVHRH
jgi:hypothetical protein